MEHTPRKSSSYDRQESSQYVLDLRVDDTPARGEARRFLAPFEDIIRSVFAEAWRIWIEQDPSYRVMMTSSSRASDVNAIVVHLIKRHFAAHPDKRVRLQENNGFLVMIVDQRIGIRFKKGDRYGRTSNILTKQQQALLWQRPLPGLPGPITIVSAVYVLNHEHEHVPFSVGSERWPRG